MAQFMPAFEYLMNFEDPSRSYKKSVDNNGGGVIAGVNSKSYPTPYEKIAALPVGQRGRAVSIFYQTLFWNPMKIGGLTSQDVANRVLDMAVNAGPATSARLFQKAVNAILRGEKISEDGRIGESTLAAANGCDTESLLASFRSQRVGHYEKCDGSPQLHEVWRKRAMA